MSLITEGHGFKSHLGLGFFFRVLLKLISCCCCFIFNKCLWSNFIHSKIFNLTKCSEILIKYSLLITHTKEGRFEFDTSYGNYWRIQFSNNQFLNSIVGVCLTSLDCKLSFKCKTFPPSTPLGQVICCNMYCRLQIIISVPRMFS